MSPRPDPDRLLKNVQAEEAASSRGKLKLFFGACAGVGKTYAMLEAAQQRRKEGVDVVVGIVETHGRAETAALLKDLQVLPLREIEYRSVKLKEFDLDGALARKPGLILVDELAHSNAPGSRHAKRWQDIDELLQAGIDVYTALNVQHWESLNDVVTQITSVPVQETVPDTFLQQAHEVELVDLAPEDLIRRLKDGKVYLGDRAVRAADNFFQPGNLVALRELALRHAAEQVDRQVQAFKEKNFISRIWPVRERLLVCVSSSPSAARLIRAGFRMATSLRCEWIVVHITTPSVRQESAREKGQIIENLRLADELGAETVTLTGRSVTEELMNYARSRNVTKIILGKPARPRWRDWLFGSIIDEMARQCGEIDLYIISGEARGGPVASKKPARSRGVRWIDMVWGAVVVAACTGVSHVLFPYIDRANLLMIYLLGLVWVAYRHGRGPSLAASVLSVLCFDFFFVPPYHSFAVTDSQYIITFVVLLVVGLVISYFTGALRQQIEFTREREQRSRMLYTMSQTLSETPDPAGMLEIAGKRLGEFYGYPLLLLGPTAEGALRAAVGDETRFGLDAHELNVARWVFEHGQPAGAGTDTLAGSKGLYIPLKGMTQTMGVLAVRPPDSELLSGPEDMRLLEAFARLIGGALESTEATESAGLAKAQADAERLRNLVLTTFSFEIHGPLQKMGQIVQRLLRGGADGIAPRRDLEELREEAGRLEELARDLPQLLEPKKKE